MELRDELEATDRFQAVAGDNGLVFATPGEIEGALTIGGGANRVSAGLEGSDEARGVARVVVGDEDSQAR